MAALLTTASPLLRRYTLEELWELPEPADHSKLELIAGVLYMSPPPSNIHNSLVARITLRLARHILVRRLRGELRPARAALWFGDTYLEPDLHYIGPERLAAMGDHPTTADLVIEILSPATAVFDRTAKADTYGAMGVGELWLVDPDTRTVEVRVQTGSAFGSSRVFRPGDSLESTVLPELRLSVRKLFQG